MKNEELTLEELVKKRKTVKLVIYILAGMILVYGIYFVTSLVNGTWKANNSVSTIGLGLLVVALSSLSLRLSAIQKEISSHKNSN